MVVLVKQLGFVEGQITLSIPREHIAIKLPAFICQLLVGAEQTGVIGHVKHRGELNTPWIHFRFSPFLFFPKDFGAAVHLACDFHVPPCSEDGTGSRIRIEQGEILG